MVLDKRNCRFIAAELEHAVVGDAEPEELIPALVVLILKLSKSTSRKQGAIEEAIEMLERGIGR